MIVFTKNYKRNLIVYWRQFYPGWEIPVGYHVHHIKPKCTFKDKDDSRIHHPSNLIALHPDDHVTIHKCRGDKFISKPLILAINGRKATDETRKDMAERMKGNKRACAMKGKPKTKEHANNISKGKKGKSPFAGMTHPRLGKSKEPKEIVKMKQTKLSQKRKWMNNGEIAVFICSNEIDLYCKLGYNMGRGNTYKRKRKKN